MAKRVAIIPLVSLAFSDGRSTLRPRKLAYVDAHTAKGLCDGDRARRANRAEIAAGQAVVDAGVIVADAQAQAQAIVEQAEAAASVASAAPPKVVASAEIAAAVTPRGTIEEVFEWVGPGTDGWQLRAQLALTVEGDEGRTTLVGALNQLLEEDSDERSDENERREADADADAEGQDDAEGADDNEGGA